MSTLQSRETAPCAARMVPAVGLRDSDLEIIRATTLFSALCPQTLEDLLADATVRTVERGEVLFLQGEKAEGFYVVLDGWVKVFRVTPGGDEAVVGIFTRGQNFAEAAAFAGGVYPASGEAVTESRVLRIAARHLNQRICENPEIALAILASTSRHLHMLVCQIEQLKAHTGAQRVAEFLVDLAPASEGACTIALPYDKALIAARLGMKPESLSRAFQRLKEEGVKINNNKAVVSRLENLQAFVDQERSAVLRSRGNGHCGQ